MMKLRVSSGVKIVYTFMLVALVFGVSEAKAFDLNEGFVSFWTFDNVDSNVDNITDVHSGKNNGSMEGDKLRGEPGIRLECMEFDGSSDLLRIPADNSHIVLSSDTVAATYTVSMWVNSTDAGDAFGNANANVYFEKRAAGAGDHPITIHQYNGGTVSWYAEDAGTGNVEESPSSIINDGEFHHIVVSRNATRDSLLIWFDGNLSVNTSNTYAMTTGSRPITMGCRLTNADAITNCITGKIDEVGLWNRTLNKSEVAKLYGGGSPPSYYNFTPTPPSPSAATNLTFNVSLLSPPDDDTNNVRTEDTDFVFYPFALNNTWASCSLYTNETGKWEEQNRRENNVTPSHYWDYDFNETNTSDTVGFIDGSVNGAVYNVTGYIGGGLVFDGGSDFVRMDIQSGEVSGYSVGTLAAWVKHDSCSAGYCEIVGVGDKDDASSDAKLGSLLGVAQFSVRNDGGNLLEVRGNTSIDDGNWHFVVMTVDDNSNVIYVDGEKEGNYITGNNGTRAFFSDVSDVDIFRVGNNQDNGGHQYWWEGMLDEVMVFNYSLSFDEVTSLYLNTSKAFVKNRRNNSLSSAYNVTNTSIQIEWGVECCLSAGNCTTADSNFTYTVDLDSPTIALRGSNAYRSNNMSNINQYGDLFVWNLSFTDNYDIFGFSINLTNSSGVVWDWNNLSIPSPTTSKTFENITNMSGWAEGVYNSELVVADKHTAKAIEDYDVSLIQNKIKFKTKEKNQIEILSADAVSSKTSKLKDRYKFSFDYPDLKSTRVYSLTADNPIHYYEESSFPGHFVVWNGKGGNWIDFSTETGEVSVKKINDREFEVTVTTKDSKDKLDFSSIGGLNVYSINNSWYRGEYATTFGSIVAVGSFQEFVLNVSRDLSYINLINATLTYEGVGLNVSRTEYPTFVEFVSSMTVPGTAAFNELLWVVNVTQNDSSTYTFIVNESQEVRFARLDFQFFNEQNFTPIYDTLEVFFTEQLSFSRFAYNGTLTEANLTLGEWFVEAEGDNWTRRGRFFNVTQQAQNVSMYLLQDDDCCDYIDYILLDTGQDAVDDARTTFWRDFNGTRYLMAQADSDFAGQVRMWQDQGYEYPITIDSELGIKEITLRPIRTLYTIFIEALTPSQYQNVFDGISYAISPREQVLNTSLTYQNITFELSSVDPSIDYFGVILDNHPYTCIPASCISNISGLVYGGTATVQVLLDANASLTGHFFFKRSGFDLQFVNGRNWAVVLLEFFGTENLLEVMASLRDGMGGRAAATLFSSIVVVALVVLAAQMGIFGMGLLLVTVLGTVFMMLTGFLALLPGIVTVVVGIALYVTMARDE